MPCLPEKVIWLPGAVFDLERLDDFLRPKNPDAASRSMSAIWRAANSLLENPNIGRPYSLPEYRELSIPFGGRGYILRYRVEGKAILVVRVWHDLEER